MIVDRIIPNPLTLDVDELRRARLIVYAIGVAVTATMTVALITTLFEDRDRGLMVALSASPYLVLMFVLWSGKSVRLTAHLFVTAVFTMIAIDLGKESSYGILAGIALPVAAAALLGVKPALVWTGITVVWQVYLAPTVFRADDVSFEFGVSTAVVTLAVGIASAVVERLREQAMNEAQTQRRKLEDYSDRIRLFAETTFPAMLVLVDGVVEEINEGFESLLQHDEQITPDNISDFVHADDLAQLQTQTRNASGVGFRTEFRMRHASGRWIWIELFGIPLPDDHDRTAWLFVARDAHDEVVSRDRLLQAQKLSSVGTMAAGLAHDLNNLLTVVVGHASLLDGGEGRDQILDASHRATELIRSLRSFTQAQEKPTELVDLVDVIREVRDMSERLLGSRINLEIDIQVERALVRIESGALNQLLLNLMTNAKEAIDDSGTIKVGLERMVEPDQNNFVLLVSDDGHGMSESTLKRATEPFYSTKGLHQASGLGLASAYGIAKRAGGNLLLFSELGRGTTVRVELPEADDAGQSPLPVPQWSKQLYTGERCVLVEDDQGVRDVLTRCLKLLGFDVYAAADAEKGLQLVREHKPKLVITDIVMPGMRGSEFALQLRANYPDLPILLISGYDQDQTVEQHANDAKISFLAKPIGVADLARQLGTLLAQADQS